MATSVNSPVSVSSPASRHVVPHGISPIIPLGLLAAGMTGTIVEIEGRPDVVVRLQEMGLRPGSDVRMVRPGEVCIVAINNHRFGFRGAEAAVVLVAVRQSAPV